MEITYLPTLLPTLKYKYLLLDANVFRDASAKPSIFNEFFNDLKNADITLATIHSVRYELLKGSATKEKYEIKEKLIDDIVDITMPIMPKTFELSYELIDIYGADGSQLSLTDLLLGATLLQYKKNIFLMTRDTTDFLQSIFELPFIVNAPHAKGIFTYGIYQYGK
jgi:predicted nucleic acid-binding protein